MSRTKRTGGWTARLRAVISFAKRIRVLDATICLLVGWACWRLMLPYLNPSLDCLRGKVAFWGDEGIVVHSADRIRRGEVLYRDFFNFQGPLGYLPFTIAFMIGPITAKVGRGTMIVMMALWCAVTCLTVKEITRKIWAGVLVALYFPLCIWPTWPYAYEHFLADLWITCAVLFAIYGERGNLRRGWLIAGLFGAMSFWTSIPEGFCGIVALFLCSLVIRYATKARWHLLAQFAGGFGAVTGAICLYFAARGGFMPMVRAVFVFPFTNYVEKNKTEYAFDAPDYVRLWTARGKTEGRIVELMLEMTKSLPKIAMVVALLVAIVILERASHRYYTRRVKGGRTWEVLGPCAIAASLGALAVPVWWGTTRNDVCHLGFIQQTSVIALTALWFPISSDRLAKLRWRVAQLFQLLTGVAVAAILVQVHGFADANATEAAKIEALEKRDLDAYIGRQMKVKAVMARIRPDELFVENYGGYTHLLSQRGDAISFPHLGNEAYYEGQYPVASREIVTKRPRALFMSADAFSLFAKHEPSIRKLYIGVELNYFLAETHPGPPLHLEVPFLLSVYGPGGAVRRSIAVFRRGGLETTPLIAELGDRSTNLFTYHDGDRVQILDGNAVYVLELAPDGNSMRGTYFEGLDITRHADLERYDGR